MLLGLSGFAGSGKDTVADILVKNHGFARYGLADPMRQALYTLNPSCHGVSLAALVDSHGWDGAKRDPFFGPEVRRLLQRFGTEVGREQWGENFWVDLAFEACKHETNVVIPDVRFPNEAQDVRDRQGQVGRIDRPGVGPLNGHSSDAGLPAELVDRSIQNNGGLTELESLVDSVLQQPITI